jgi:hypothetical protein
MRAAQAAVWGQSMDLGDLLTALAVLIALFLVMAAAVEMILETVRGLLEQFGIEMLKGGVSLDDALKISAEFVPDGSAAAARVSALVGMARETGKVTAETLSTLETLRDELAAAATPQVAGPVLEQVSQVVAQVRETLDASERTRVFLLRALAAAIGVALAFAANVDGLNLALQAAPGKEVVVPGLSKIMTGLDQLDRVRSLKGAYAQVAKLGSKG